MKRSSMVLLFWLCLLSSLSCLAQQYHFKTYTVANGLGSSSVNSIFQDSKGYIWFATQGGGASRFNGREFKNFTRTDGLISNDVTCITEDKQGNIWIATAEGASEFTGTQFLNYHLANGLTNGVVYSIYAGADDTIYFATQDRGIRILTNAPQLLTQRNSASAHFDSLTMANGLPSNETYSIAKDRKGNYWFGLWKGISRLREGKIKDYSNLAGIKDETFFSTLVDYRGNVWFGSTTGDVIIIDENDSITKLELPAGLKKDFIGGIAQDKKHNIWFSTDHGLLKYAGKAFKLFGEKEGLAVSTVQAVMCDYEDNVWAATLNGGVAQLSSEAFAHFSDKDGLSSANITAICTSPDNTLYIGTGNGLNLSKPNTKDEFRKVTEVKAIDKINITSIELDSKGLVWISAQEGIFVLEKNGLSLKLKREYHKMAGQNVVSPLKIIQHSNGDIWIASYGSGIFRFNGSVETNYNVGNGFKSDKILTLFEDSKANIWFGTQDAGVIKYDGQTFTQVSLLPAKAMAANLAVWSIAEDRQGTMFFGTGESGLFRVTEKQITNYTTKDGLVSSYIPALSWDTADKSLWIGYEKGLDKVKFTSTGKLEVKRTYTEKDGFNSTSINQNGIKIDKQGLVWLCTTSGLWRFNRKYDFTQITSPKIQLTGIRLAYQITDWRKFTDSMDSRSNLPLNLKLPYNKNHLTFDIQALTTSEVKYVYMLEGQDIHWSSPTKSNEITYSNISPGHYTFKAKTLNIQNEPAEEILQFSIVINPPWWQTWWFYVSALLVLTSALFFIIKIRENALLKENARLENMVQQRTIEISQQKRLVEETLTQKERLLLEKEILLLEIHHRVKNNLQTISSMLMMQSTEIKDEQAKKALAESQTRVKSIALVHQKLYQSDGLEKIEFNAFIKELIGQIRPLYGQQSDEVEIIWEIPETYILIDMAIPLGLILNELFTNSFKYAFNEHKIGKIEIALLPVAAKETPAATKLSQVNLIYRDNGPGLSSSQFNNTATLGLRLIKLLSQQIGATVNYTTESGSRYIFTFTIKL